MTGPRSTPSAAPSPLSGFTTFLVAVAFVFIAGFGLAAAAAALALGAGLAPDRAISLLSDPANSPLVTSPAWIALTLVVNELSVAAAFWLASRRLGARLSDLVPLTRPNAFEVLGALVLIFGLAPAAELAAELAYRFTAHDLVSEQLVFTVAQQSGALGFTGVLLIVALMPALVEESLFRGLLMRAFQRYGAVVAVLVSSALFGALHLDPSQAAGTFLLGLGFGAMRWITGSIVPSMVSHAVYNAVVVLAARFAPPSEAHTLRPGAALLGLVAAAFGAWLLLRGQRARGEL